jgi:hypothetical protein
MSALERDCINNQPLFVRWVRDRFSGDCAACLPGQLWTFARTNFTYLKDGPSDEVIRAPHILLLQGVGDCDCISLFLKTCLDIIGGWTAHYILFGVEKNVYTHIAIWAYREIAGVKTDPVLIDGLAPVFNKMSSTYKYFKII